jgi:hypothetical protein
VLLLIAAAAPGAFASANNVGRETAQVSQTPRNVKGDGSALSRRQQVSGVVVDAVVEGTARKQLVHKRALPAGAARAPEKTDSVRWRRWASVLPSALASAMNTRSMINLRRRDSTLADIFSFGDTAKRIILIQKANRRAGSTSWSRFEPRDRAGVLIPNHSTGAILEFTFAFKSRLCSYEQLWF